MRPKILAFETTAVQRVHVVEQHLVIRSREQLAVSPAASAALATSS